MTKISLRISPGRWGEATPKICAWHHRWKRKKNIVQLQHPCHSSLHFLCISERISCWNCCIVWRGKANPGSSTPTPSMSLILILYLMCMCLPSLFVVSLPVLSCLSEIGTCHLSLFVLVWSRRILNAASVLPWNEKRTWFRKLQKAVAVRNSLLENFSGKFRRCWKILPRFSSSTKCYPCQGLDIFRQGKWLLENRPRLQELLDVLLWDRHNLLELFWMVGASSRFPVLCFILTFKPLRGNFILQTCHPLRGPATILFISLAMLSAIVSQNCFVLVFLGHRTSIARYVAEWGIALLCPSQTRHQGGYRILLGDCWDG